MSLFKALDTGFSNYENWEEAQIEASAQAMEVEAELTADAEITTSEPPETEPNATSA